MDTRRKFINPGFTLVEILVAMAIVALMATQAPRLIRFNYNQQEKLLAHLNMLARNAYTHALVTGHATQLFFNFETSPKKVTIRVETEKHEGPEHTKVFEDLHSDYGNDAIVWDDHFEIEKFIIDGKDEASGSVLKTIWIYIMPEGLAQQAHIVMRNTLTQEQVNLELNPFFVQFSVV